MNIHTAALNRAVSLLKSIGANAIIHGGEEMGYAGTGDIEELLADVLKSVSPNYRVELGSGRILSSTTRDKNSGPFLKRGTMLAVYKPYLEQMTKVGDVCTIPVPEDAAFDVGRLQTAVAAACGKMWGNGTYLTSLDRERNVVEVLRTEAAERVLL